MKKIALQANRGKNKFTLVDDDVYKWAKNFKWYLSCNGYAQGFIKNSLNSKSLIFLHREIMRTGKEFVVDHINHDKLNNQRKNLRNCSRAENQFNQKLRKDNTSGFKGVRFNKKTGKWRADIMMNRRSKFLGHFPSAQEAAKAYTESAKRLFGRFFNPQAKEGKSL